MAYTVFRSDNLPGIDNRSFICSVLVQDSDGNDIEVENGAIVKIGALIDGAHDLWAATLAASGDDVAACGVIGTPEVIYDESVYHNLDEFINVAGIPAAAYKLDDGGIFSVTAEGFVDGTVPAVGDEVGIGADGKIDASGSGLGTVIAIDVTSRYTYYAIKL